MPLVVHDGLFNVLDILFYYYCFRNKYFNIV